MHGRFMNGGDEMLMKIPPMKDTKSSTIGWRVSVEEGFIHTTNTDGYHLRSGCQTDKILEVHGSMWRLQCLDACSYNYWEEGSSSSLRLRPKIYESFQLPNLYFSVRVLRDLTSLCLEMENI